MSAETPVAALQFKYVTIEVNNHVAVVRVTRPPRNAMNSEAFDNIYAALLDVLRDDDDVKVVVITGGVRNSFGVGAELDQLFGPGVTQDLIDGNDEPFHRIRLRFEEISKYPKPIVAAINGVCIGASLELAMICDYRVASELAYFSFPETDIEIITTAGATVWLPRLIGIGRAKEMLMLGRRINAKTALDWGLVNRIVPQKDVLKTAMEIAEQFSAKYLPAVVAMKRCVTEFASFPVEEGMRREVEEFITLMRHKLVERKSGRRGGPFSDESDEE